MVSTDSWRSVEADRQSIQQEVRTSGKVREVEDAVMTLRMNMSTAELQRTAALVGPLGDVSRFSWYVSR